MGTRETHTVSWRSNDGKVVLTVTGTHRVNGGDHHGRIEYVWTLANVEAGVTNTWTSRAYGAVYSGVGEHKDASKAMKTLVEFFDAWHEAKGWEDNHQGQTSENADMFKSDNSFRDDMLLELYRKYGDEMYADCAIELIEDSSNPTMREYK